MTNIGIINPGAMGISIAASLKTAGHEVLWSSNGRSPTSRERAAKHELSDLRSLAALGDACEIILSVCPPHAAEAVARSVVEHGFRGIFCDGNAIAPQKSRAIGESLSNAGIAYVDGSIVGPPAWQPGSTRFYMSGPRAIEIASLFDGSLTEAIVIGEEIGRASALKMVFAAQTKGFTALISAIQATAESLGVRADLDREWERRDPDIVAKNRKRVRGVTEKAWRFTGEMQEIAATFEGTGVPNGFFLAAHEVYQRMAQFKDAEELPALEQVLAALLDVDGIPDLG